MKNLLILMEIDLELKRLSELNHSLREQRSAVKRVLRLFEETDKEVRERFMKVIDSLNGFLLVTEVSFQ